MPGSASPFLSVSTVSGFPVATCPGILDALNHLRLGYRWGTRFICLDKAEAKALLEKYRRQWWQKRKGETSRKMNRAECT